MERLTGQVVHKIPIKGDKPYYLLDNQSNIVQVNKTSKRVRIFNIEMEFSIETIYDDCFDGVYATVDNYLALVNGAKKFVVFV
jgi:hypothetical protein